MKYNVYCKRTGFDSEWVWEYDDIITAQTCVTELLDRGSNKAWIEPASEAEAIQILEAEVASLKGRLKSRNRQIRDLRRSIRK